MEYSLQFHPKALSEWKKLAPSIQQQFKKQLAKRLVNPKHAKDQLRTPLHGCYKLKLKQLGYRLVYQVNDDALTVMVIAVGKREKAIAYEKAIKRLDHP